MNYQTDLFLILCPYICSKSDSCNSLHLVLIYFSFQVCKHFRFSFPPWILLFSKSKVINCSKFLTISTLAQFSSVQFLSCLTLCSPMDCSTPGIPLHQVGDASNHLILCHPLLLLPLNFPSIRVFSNESIFHIRWPKYWSFSFSINSSNDI